MLYPGLTCQKLKGFCGENHDGCPQFLQRARLFLGSLPGMRGGEQGTAGSFAILCELGERLCQFSA